MHLVLVDGEILAQRRQPGYGFGGLQIGVAPLKISLVGQYRKAARAIASIGVGDALRIEIGADHALGRRGLFYLGDQRHTLPHQRSAKILRLGQIAGVRTHVGQAATAFALGDEAAFVLGDLRENIGHLRRC